MGKGRRLRQQRGSTPRVEVLADYPFEVDEHTVTEFGREGLAELALNLWPVDCQSCGWDLGSGKPTVRVVDMVTMASATLHHARCQPALWTEEYAGSFNPLVSWAIRSFVMPGEVDGQQDNRALALVNPQLEQAMFVRDDDGRWVIDTVGLYRKMGLQTPFQDFVVDKPIPDISATLDGDELTITLDDSGQSWQVGCDGPVGKAIRDLSGVILGVSTAVHPHQIRVMGEMIELMQSGRVAMGWIALDGAEQPLPEPSVPAQLSTYVLHWGSGHLSVGELLATTDRSLSVSDAQAWAINQIDLNRDALLAWQPVHHDAHAWYTLDALSASHYFVRQHTDAWKLFKILSRVGSEPDLHEDDIRNWATRAVRIHGGHRIISWVTGPSTEPGFTTLHGSAAPR